MSDSTMPAAATHKPEASAKSSGGGGGEEKSRYRATLNLPKTAFAMKASLVQNEPASLKRWQAMGLYEKIREAKKGKPKFVFHDGPPYANGNLHLGHLLNKCLKDFVVRSRGMMGFDCAYVPGWDCHGLPIEHKVVSDMKDKGKLDKVLGLPEDQRKMAIRRECQAHAEKYVKLQRAQMERFLTIADYEHPYLTLHPSFEGATLEVLAELCEQGLVYRALKPVHWSIANETALAEAELEYYDREDLSVYVDFEAVDAGAVYDAFGLPKTDLNAEDAEEGDAEDAEGDGKDQEKATLPKPGVRPSVRPSFMIWTTTPWTLAANLAIAVHPASEYALVFVDGNVTVMASALVEKVTRAAKAEDVVVIARTTGDKLVGLRYRHPFVDPARGEGLGSKGAIEAFKPPHGATFPPGVMHTVVAADYVTLEDGTGLVHTAPGHGSEDFQTGQKVGLPAYCPVREDGTYDASVPEWLRGQSIWKANDDVTRHLQDTGHLFYQHKFTHSYPHDWRSKTPVIFRCTYQWFVGVDRAMKKSPPQAPSKTAQSLRQMALGQTARVGEPGHQGASEIKFVPEWGRNRMRGMLESRPDWCISRQRSWGMPIPAFHLPDGTVFMTPASIRAVAKLVREKGTDIWFSAAPEELLKYYDPAADSDCPHSVSSSPRLSVSSLRKGPDIVDVWFESGSTWNACMRERNLGFPMDLYLEGSDQHRGWFQSSLLPSLGVTGVPPFKTLLTHGFIVDKDGKKLSKSRPDAARYEVESLCNEFGMDVMRWWVASLPYENDIKADLSFFAEFGESYRKVRNTIRFVLSNLDDFVVAGGSTAGGMSVPPSSAGGTPTPPIPPTSIDAWVLGELDALIARVVKGYEDYDFRSVQQAIYDFCNDTLSATYLAAIKDRLYCDKPDSARRRRTQAVLWDLASALARLLAPIMPHTADEAWRALWKTDPKDATRCVHLGEFPTPSTSAGSGVKPDASWAKVIGMLPAAQTALEKAKKPPSEGGLGVENPLDAGVVLPDPDGTLARFDASDLADLLGVSRVQLDRAASAKEPRVIDLRTPDNPRCERSWKRDGTVKQRADGGWLSDRDALAVGVA